MIPSTANASHSNGITETGVPPKVYVREKVNSMDGKFWDFIISVCEVSYTCGCANGVNWFLGILVKGVLILMFCLRL